MRQTSHGSGMYWRQWWELTADWHEKPTQVGSGDCFTAGSGHAVAKWDSGQQFDGAHRN